MALDDKSTEKSRREKRKEARLGKNKKKFDSWVQHQQSRKETKKLLISKSKDAKKLSNDNQILKRKEVELMNSDDEGELEQGLKQEFNGDDSFIELNDPKRKKGSINKSKIKSQEVSGKKRKKSKTENEEADDEEIDDDNDGESGAFDASFKKYDKKDPKKSKMMKQKKTKFEEYMETEMHRGVMSAEEDLALERRLAKKLKVKQGKLGSDDLDLNWLIEGLPTFDELEDKKGKTDEVPPKKRNKTHSHKKDEKTDLAEQEKISEDLSAGVSEDLEDKKTDEVPPKKRNKTRSRKKDEKTDSAEQEKISEDLSAGVSEATEMSGEDLAKVKAPLVEPAMGGKTKYVAPHLRSRMGNESEEYAQIRRRIRGLLNRMSESNVESITAEISMIFRSMGRSVGSQVIGEEVVSSCSGGPRGNDQYAAVFSAFVAGMACSVGIDFGAKLLSSLARCFEDEYVKEDNLSLRNLTLLLSYLYTFGVCSSELIYDFLIMLSKRLTEVDVSTILTVLQACGMKLRSDDPVGMKNFILNVQSRVNELKTSSGEGESDISGKRMEFMLETICNIKNNKTRPKEDSVQQTRIKKWLQKLRVGDILIRGLKWSKLLDPDKKGQWWLSGDIASTADNVEEVAGTIDKEVLEAQKLLQLAAAQRMNTDARRAIFCIIMSGEDYIDAFEKLLRLDLPGKQDREIMRVLVECCLQEKAFNKYYCVLASKLCSHDKNHKFTLQYCLWDHYKELESMQLVRSMHLAKFVAEMIASFSISISVLKAVDLTDTAQLTPQRIMHFRMLFEAIFQLSDKIIWNVFTRIAVTPEYESLRNGIELFANKYVVSFDKSLASKYKVVKKALNNLEGILM